MDQILERVIAKIGEVVALSPEEVGPDASLVDELGADSLDFVELMYLMEHEFGVRFGKAFIGETTTWNAYVEYAASLYYKDWIGPAATHGLRINVQFQIPI